MLGHQLDNNLKGSDSFFNVIVNGWSFGWNGIPVTSVQVKDPASGYWQCKEGY